MNGHFDCHEFFDNTNLALLEIFLADDSNNRRYEGLLISKEDLYVKGMELKVTGGSSWIQERFFDLGFTVSPIW